ncbi:alpha/beta fold hydrolase [Pendulispora brunnea]|uniref:Alpha/beta fold hydrolase n=1 Tax=Pendulispora brunnea TaxID=2905690 RepID=A0ABZ2KRF3_9BACT
MVGCTDQADRRTGPTRGPSGLAFYQPPSPLTGNTHGDLIWIRDFPSTAALPHAAKNLLLLYRSTNLHGAAIAISGILSVPPGNPPASGWPVITYAHGTSGIGTSCAPSLDTPDAPTHSIDSYIVPALDRWVQNGWAVLRTDYEGLGTPGPHPYIIGVSEGRAVLDIVRAAKQADGTLSNRVVIAGHSQGGHAALWAAGLAPEWTPDIDVVGTVAFAPASHFREQLRPLIATSSPTGVLGAVGMMAIRGVDVAYPQLQIPSLLSAQAKSLWPQTETACLVQFQASDSFGGLPPNMYFAEHADLAGLETALGDQNPGQLTISTPALILQGGADSIILPHWTELLRQEFEANGSNVVLRVRENADHGSIVVGESFDEATAWIRARFAKD